MLKERLAQGQPDTPELRAAIRDELNTRELLVREAKKNNLDKNAEIKQQMDLAGQTVLVRAYVTDWIKKNPIPDAELRKEYDTHQDADGRQGVQGQAHPGREGRRGQGHHHATAEGRQVRRAREVALEGSGFSKDRGGDLDWNAPADFVKPFGDAMVATPKGKFTAQPVQTQFGYHVILVEDVRDAKVPPFEEVKPQMQQRMQAAHLDKYFKELRAEGRRVGNARSVARAKGAGRSGLPFFISVACIGVARHRADRWPEAIVFAACGV